ncbi:serine/threonine protein phosphatase [Sphingosinicella sp. LY1275]|uniref:serine/threonine protein phosphatase n=1 Tax=Sphingosinicella sp. LY1275 TaxID=3095379 RepID=UPI002ADEE412|nr:serine/threonine protein phosphatase [Sphingosinicella sp. LY1275]MEA1015545.1 serine/threonine protein phosphatase [Sphingosinicella sp. LY1275]
MKTLSNALKLGCCMLATLAAAPLAAAPVAPAVSYRSGACGDFTIAVIPDTQNYLDYRHQKAAGYPIEAANLFFEQMRYVADNARSAGGDIVFATHVGDVWQHYSRWSDPAHELRGFKSMPNAMTSQVAAGPRPETLSFEIPNAVKGFSLIAGKLPFSVVPGNHDYDALWTDPTHPPQPEREGRLKIGIRHLGGLTGYLSAFSDQSEFFKGQPWYAGSHDDGADSAQIVTAGQCRLLHIGLQFDAPDASLAWAERTIRRHPGLPTIVTIHKYLDRDGKRADTPALDLSILDHRDNNPQMVWDEFVSRHDQIFLVLSGHIGGQGYSVDANLNGRPVHQVMADFQDRSQVAKQAGVKSGGAIGDGWMRLLKFRLDDAKPNIEVRTYSTHYRKFSSELKDYAAWYKAREGQAALSDEAFLARDSFVIPLDDFHARFGGR